MSPSVWLSFSIYGLLKHETNLLLDRKTLEIALQEVEEEEEESSLNLVENDGRF